jgi:lysophospholipase L1-like esterase
MLGKETIRMLALGDSYTVGEGVAQEDSFPMLFAAQCNEYQSQRKSGVCKEPDVVAKTGWTTDELIAAITGPSVEALSIREQYDWVTLLIGVNNQYRNRPVTEFQQDLRWLLNYSIQRAGGNSRRVIVLSIPDWGVTPFAKDRDAKAIASQIDVFNEAKKAHALEAGCHYVDITDISRLAGEGRSDLLAEDGLHPSREMYQMWCERLLPIVVGYGP